MLEREQARCGTRSEEDSKGNALIPLSEISDVALNTMISVQRQYAGGPSIAVLPWTSIATILSLVHSAATRNRVSEVCRAFRLYERQTRRFIAIRSLQRNLIFVPQCFSSVTSLDLSAMTLLPGDLPSFSLDRGQQNRLAKAFPHVRTLKIMAMNDESILVVGRIWPRIESLSFINHKEVQSPPQLKTVLETFRHCEVLDARNLMCESLALAFPSADHSPLKSLNFETFLIWKDADLEILAKKCVSLESLSITVHPGRVTEKGFQNLETYCRKLTKMRLFFYMDTLRGFSPESARRCLQSVVKMVAESPDIQISVSFQHIPSTITGQRMECLTGMASSISTLVVYTTDTEMKGILSCKNLTEVTFGSCESLCDRELLSVAKACPKLTTLRILDCRRVTERGLAQVAKLARLTSLSLCFLKIRVKALLDAIKPMSLSLCALRLTISSGVNSLSGLSGWPHLSRLELTVSCQISRDVLSEPWLESCPNLKHLGLVFQNWCPSTLQFLLILPSLPSLSLSISTKVPRDVFPSFLDDIALVPQLSSLSLYICNEQWLTEDAGAMIATCATLKNLNIIWTSNDRPFEDLKFSLRPFMLKLLNMKCLQNVRLPFCLVDENHLKIFYQGLHAHTVHSLLKSMYDLKVQGSNSLGQSAFHYRKQ